MTRWLTTGAALVALSTAGNAFAQAPAAAPRAAPSRPPLFFSEGWQPLETPADGHGAWPASQGGVASPNLELSLHGASGKEIQLVAVRGQSDLYPMNLWTGTTTSPSAASLRDRDNFVDLSDPLAKIRWIVRTSGFHQVRPIIKLADGTWLIGDRATGPSVDFNIDDISIADVRWMKLDIDRVVTVGGWVENPNLHKVDEVGFADLFPGSGHGPGGYANVARIEVYGRPVKR
ncbi:MAG TPA: hypothetical protein VFV10_08400 [Gammaproteobacteria bacterium]|nr:hypothetical protein [Gammaproteobacteria bacterium]